MDNSVIKSYVPHGEKWYFVSTIERDCSHPYGGRYNETLVWEYDMQTKERGRMFGPWEDGIGGLKKHFQVCERIFRGGEESLLTDDTERTS